MVAFQYVCWVWSKLHTKRLVSASDQGALSKGEPMRMRRPQPLKIKKRDLLRTETAGQVERSVRCALEGHRLRAHSWRRDLGAPPWFFGYSLCGAPRCRPRLTALPSPDFCDMASLFRFLSYFLVSISVSLLFLLVLNMWHRSQITNSEMFIILISK